jgi:hypothetical protein
MTRSQLEARIRRIGKTRSLPKLFNLHSKAIDLDALKKRPKKQSTRMLKCRCSQCGFTVRTTRGWLRDVGLPRCAVLKHGPMACDDFEEVEE